MNPVPIKGGESLERNAMEAILAFLNPPERQELSAYLELRKWQAGQIVMKDGDPGDFMGFLLDGKLAVKKETAFAGKYAVVAILDRGAMVGEASVFDTARRTATVEALAESRLLVLSRSEMDRLFRENRDLALKILKQILHVLNMRLQNADDRLAWLL